MIGKIAIVAIAAIGLSGCATIIQGTKQTMSVNTTPVDGAKCELTNATGTWYVTTPGSVEVHKTKTDLKVACEKEGVGKGTMTVESHFGGTTFGNAIVGGLVGVAVDAASGANFYYHSPISVALVPDAPAPGAAPADTPPAGAKPAEPVVPADAKPAEPKPAEPKAADNKVAK